MAINCVFANNAYDIEHDVNFNNEMSKLGFKFDGNSGIGDRQICHYKLNNSDEWDKYNITGFLIFADDKELKEDVNSSDYRPYEINNISGYISENNMSFITQMDNGHYIKYYVDNIQDLNVLVKDYWN